METNTIVHYGQNIKKLATSLGFPAEKVAADLGRTVSTVFKIYNREHVDTEVIEILSTKWHVPIKAFFGESYDFPYVSESGDIGYTFEIKKKDQKIEMLELQLKHYEERLKWYEERKN